MFLHTLVEKKQVDLDKFLDNMREDPKIVNTMIDLFGSLEYAFIVECVDKQIQKIKEYTPMPIEGE